MTDACLVPQPPEESLVCLVMERVLGHRNIWGGLGPASGLSLKGPWRGQRKLICPHCWQGQRLWLKCLISVSGSQVSMDEEGYNLDTPYFYTADATMGHAVARNRSQFETRDCKHISDE